nr:DUF2637 domain-containing protein [Actinomadura syzygii]
MCWATTVSVVVLAGIAAVLSYKHLRVLVLEYGETSWTAALLPVSADGMIVASSMTLLADSRNGRRSGPLPACADLRLQFRLPFPGTLRRRPHHHRRGPAAPHTLGHALRSHRSRHQSRLQPDGQTFASGSEQRTALVQSGRITPRGHRVGLFAAGFVRIARPSFPAGHLSWCYFGLTEYTMRFPGCSPTLQIVPSAGLVGTCRRDREAFV